jgi:two-component system secretion response regulator SsrB
MRVLLVDDHARVREALCGALRHRVGIKVVGQAVDGQDAIRQVERLQPRIVVMDINMPGMNGIEATAYLTRKYPTLHVIGLSHDITPDCRAAMLDAGARTVLAKDISIEPLYLTILSLRNFSSEARYV